MKKFIAMLSYAVMCSAFSAEIVFNGAGTELTVAANWTGGVAPGAGDIAVIDVSQLPAATKSLTIADDFAVGGLRVENNDRALEITGTGATLTLGACGFTNTVVDVTVANFDTCGIEFRVPIAVSCAQAWDCGRQRFITYSTVDGTADLTIAKGSFIIHDQSLGYGGKIIYSGPDASPNWTRASNVRIYGSGRWARELELHQHCYLALTNTTTWSTLFGDRYVKNCGARFVICRRRTVDGNPSGLFGRVVFEDGDKYEGPGDCGSKQGYLDITGGEWLATDWMYACYFTAYFGEDYDYGSPAITTISGGKVTAGSINIAQYLTQTTTNGYAFVQTGGEVTVSTSVSVGGGNQGSTMGWGEYRMEGGKLTINGTANGSNHGLILLRDTAGQTTSFGHGLYRQTGGEASAHRIVVGADGASSTKNQHFYTQFELLDGIFNLGLNGMVVGQYWNNDTTNNVYAIKLRGGTLRASASFESTLPWMVPAGRDFTLDTGANTIAQFAPLYGNGSLVKRGSGTAALMDASRFTGSLAVEEGTLEVCASRTPSSDTTDSDHCWIWTGDSAGSGQEEDATITSWTDDLHGLVAGQDDKCMNGANMNGALYNITNMPKVKKAMFNGHDALYFNNAALSVPNASLPLKTALSCTYVAVFKTSLGGGGDRYEAPLVTGMNGGWGDHTIDLMVGNKLSMCRYYGGGSSSRVAKSNVSFDASTVHVAIGTTSPDRTVCYLDGAMTENLVSDSTGNAFFTSQPLRFGATLPDEVNKRAFSGYLAEIRVYDRALTDEEALALNGALLDKYKGEGGDRAKLFRQELKTHVRAMPGDFMTETVPAGPEMTGAEFDADTVAAEDGAEVMSWTASTDATATKAQAGAGTLAGPRLVKNALNGHAALHFSKAEQTGLGIAAADSPLSGATDFSIMFVFRTSVDGTGIAASYTFGADGGDGILSTETGGWIRSDIGFTFLKFGTLKVARGGLGTRYIERRPFQLNDGMPHIVVCSRNVANSTFFYMVDGVAITPDADADGMLKNALGNDVVHIGTRLATGDSHFEGDIFAVGLYNHAITLNDAHALTEKLAAKYATRTLPYLAYDALASASSGLAATNVAVASGATLRLPIAITRGFTVTESSPCTFSGAGTVEGTVDVRNGGMLTLGSTAPAFSDLRFADGSALKFDELPAAPVNVSGLSASGTVAIDITALGVVKSLRQPLATGIVSEKVAAGTTFIARAAHGVNATVDYDREAGTLTLRVIGGATIILR